MRIKFDGGEFTLLKRKYSSGHTRLDLVDDEGDPYMEITKVPPDNKFNKDVVFVKNYSENEGILKVLVEQDIIKDTGNIFIYPGAFVGLNICEVAV